METTVIQTINSFGHLGIVILIAIENLFPPIPSEVILTFGGFATTITDITVIGAIIASTIGSVIGAVILHWIGFTINEEKIYSFTETKLGKVLGLKKENIKKAFSWFNSKGNYAVFFGRFIPIVRSLVSIPAGMAKMPQIPFLILTTIGSAIWNTVLILLGRIAGESWGKIAGYVGGYSDIVWLAFGIIFAIGIISYYKKKKKRIQVIMFRKSR